MSRAGAPGSWRWPVTGQEEGHGSIAEGEAPKCAKGQRWKQAWSDTASAPRLPQPQGAWTRDVTIHCHLSNSLLVVADSWPGHLCTSAVSSDRCRRRLRPCWWGAGRKALSILNFHFSNRFHRKDLQLAGSTSVPRKCRETDWDWMKRS